MGNCKTLAGCKEIHSECHTQGDDGDEDDDGGSQTLVVLYLLYPRCNLSILYIATHLYLHRGDQRSEAHNMSSFSFMLSSQAYFFIHQLEIWFSMLQSK